MKLSKHKKRIVDAIIDKRVYDIPSYLREFGKWHLCKYDLTRPTAKFTEEQDGKEYKVIIDEDKAYVKGTTPMNMGVLGTINSEIKLRRKTEDIPDDAWEYRKANLIHDVKPVEIEYKGERFSFDFMEKGVYVADNFKDIIEFLSLWAYLRQESLIIDVPKDVTVDDLGILFELKPKEPKQEIPFIIHKDKNSKSSVNPITRTLVCVTEFYDSPPNCLISSYMDEEWVLNNEYLKNCEEYIGRKIIATERLQLFANQLYTTTGEWQFRIPLIISIIALVVSFVPIIQSLIPSNEPNYLEQISHKIKTIETIASNDLISHDQLMLQLEDILNTLEDISISVDDMNSNQESVDINDLASQIKKLNEWLAKYEVLIPPQ